MSKNTRADERWRALCRIGEHFLDFETPESVVNAELRRAGASADAIGREGADVATKLGKRFPASVRTAPPSTIRLRVSSGAAARGSSSNAVGAKARRSSHEELEPRATDEGGTGNEGV
jgi:hypothetical protein